SSSCNRRHHYQYNLHKRYNYSICILHMLQLKSNWTNLLACNCTFAEIKQLDIRPGNSHVSCIHCIYPTTSLTDILCLQKHYNVFLGQTGWAQYNSFQILGYRNLIHLFLISKSPTIFHRQRYFCLGESYYSPQRLYFALDVQKDSDRKTVDKEYDP